MGDVAGRLDKLEKAAAAQGITEPTYILVLEDQGPYAKHYSEESIAASMRAADATATGPGGLRWCYPVAKEDRSEGEEL